MFVACTARPDPRARSANASPKPTNQSHPPSKARAQCGVIQASEGRRRAKDTERARDYAERDRARERST